VYCDCSRNGLISGAHSRAARYIFWKAVRPVSNCGCLASAFLAGCEELEGDSAGLVEEHAVKTAKSRQTDRVTFTYLLKHRVAGGMVRAGTTSPRTENLLPVMTQAVSRTAIPEETQGQRR